MTKVLMLDMTMAEGVDAREGDARHYHDRRWWREVKVRPNEGVAVMARGVDDGEGDVRRRDDGREEEDG